jgi:outer membrane protein OmpA-like peptidoglycan-associated protein
MNLSKERADDAQKILQRELTKAGKTGVTFKTNGYGITDPSFSNNLPEERFYNRTVVIDIIPSSTVVVDR